jgi:phosphoribosylformylglycinamidine synthase
LSSAVRAGKLLAFSMKVIVTVMPKRTVLDPQGAATAEAMKHLGLEGVEGVRVGKCIEFEVAATDEAKLHEIARDLLSNPVMEDYTLEITA